MSTLEARARHLFAAWSAWEKATFCSRCGERRACGAQHSSGPWLCLDCFDVSVEAERFARTREKG